MSRLSRGGATSLAGTVRNPSSCELTGAEDPSLETVVR